jgi:Putative restriction endonuclease
VVFDTGLPEDLTLEIKTREEFTMTIVARQKLTFDQFLDQYPEDDQPIQLAIEIVSTNWEDDYIDKLISSMNINAWASLNTGF